MTFLMMVGMRWPPSLPPHSLMSDLELPNLVLTLTEILLDPLSLSPYHSSYASCPNRIEYVINMCMVKSFWHIIKCNEYWFLGIQTIPNDCSCMWSYAEQFFLPPAWAWVISICLTYVLFRMTSGMMPTADYTVIPMWFFSISLSHYPFHREIISPWFHLAGISSSAHTDSIRGTMAWISGLPLFLIILFLKSVVHLPPWVLPTLSFLFRWGLYLNSQPQSFCLFGTPPWFACLMVYMRHNFLLQVFIVCCHILFITFVIIHSSIPIFCS